MSKKNNLAQRKKQHEFDLQREEEEREKREKKLQAKKSWMKGSCDGTGKASGNRECSSSMGKSCLDCGNSFPLHIFGFYR